MARTLFILFAFLAYAVFFATFLYFIAFVGDLPWVPRTVDRPPGLGEGPALAIDLALIAGFGIQHSVMARRGFKAVWTRLVSPAIERSVYVLAASLMLILMFLFWQPIGGDVWRVTHPAGAAILWGLFAMGWVIVLVSTFLINHFELFGLAQPILHGRRGGGEERPVLRQPFLYRLVRHPLYAGFFLAIWATPHMTLGHLLLAAGLSAYMLIAIPYEERDLVATFGTDYEAYRRRVGMLLPSWRR